MGFIAIIPVIAQTQYHDRANPRSILSILDGIFATHRDAASFNQIIKPEALSSSQNVPGCRVGLGQLDHAGAVVGRQQGFVAGLRQAGPVQRNQLQAPCVAKLDSPFDWFNQQRWAAPLVREAGAVGVPLHPGVRASRGRDKKNLLRG